MSVMSREVLAKDSGQQLQTAVRSALVDLGLAANHAALAAGQAALLEVQSLALEEGEQAAHGLRTHVAETAALLAQCAMQYHEELVVSYAVIAARYAVYAARVAADVTSEGQTVDLDVGGILPSQLIENLDQYLPSLQFRAEPHGTTVAEEQNDAIAEARDRLDNLVQRQMFGSAVTEYDTIGAAPRGKGSPDLVVEFPEALHDYAATVTWAIGVFTSSGLPATR